MMNRLIVKNEKKQVVIFQNNIEQILPIGDYKAHGCYVISTNGNKYKFRDISALRLLQLYFSDALNNDMAFLDWSEEFTHNER